MSWVKVHKAFADAKKAPEYLYLRSGKRGRSYWLRYRRDGVALEERLGAEGDFKSWREALAQADSLVAKARFGEKEQPKSLVALDALWAELLETKEAKSDATYEQAEIYGRVHLLPVLRGGCPYAEDGKPCVAPGLLARATCTYAADLNAGHWLNIKAHYRAHRPKSPIFNLWKYAGMLAKYAHDRGVLAQRPVFEYDEKKEDFKEPGHVLTREEIREIVKEANQRWRDLIVCLRLTGQRFSVFRRLKVTDVNFETSVITVRSELSKNRRYYSFKAPITVLAILRRRADQAGGPYLFPSRESANRPMSRIYDGWHAAVKRAGVNPKYTPHDLRHTFATYAFREKTANPAVICFQIDMSMEEAQKTYLHFTAEDTAPLAEAADREARVLLEGVA